MTSSTAEQISSGPTIDLYRTKQISNNRNNERNNKDSRPLMTGGNLR
jgi:hypothetical protein